MKKIAIIGLCLLLGGCSNNTSSGCKIDSDCGPQNKSNNNVDNNKLSDMSGYYSYDKNEEYRFIDFTCYEFLEKLDSKNTFVVYVGASSCPWCSDILPILNKVTKENDEYVYYIDIFVDDAFPPEGTPVREQFNERFANYFEDRGDGLHFYIPKIFYIKDGIVLKCVNSLDYDAFNYGLLDEEIEYLKNEFREGFEMIKE